MTRTLRTKLRRDIGRQRGQFVGVVLTVLVGIALYGAASDAYKNLKASYSHAFSRQRFANLTVSGGAVEDFARRAAGVRGVESVETRTVADVPLRIGSHELLGRVVGQQVDRLPGVNRVDLRAGHGLDPALPDAVLAERHLADEFHLHAGATLEVRGPAGWRRVTIRGEVASVEYFWLARNRQDNMPLAENFGVLFTPEPLARAAAGVTRPTEAVVYFRGGRDVADVHVQLTRLAHDVGAGTRSIGNRLDQPSNASLAPDIDAFGEMALLFPLLFLTAAGITIYVLLTRKVHLELPLIGTLLATGFGRRHIVGHYLGYGALAGLAGGVPGAVAGLFLAGVVTRGYTGALKIPDPVVGLHLETAAIGLAFALIGGMLAALAPALSASRISPGAAMRATAPTERGGRALLERVLPPLRRMPARWKAVLRGVERSRRRTVSTAVGVTLALALILVSWGMLDTTQAWFDAARKINHYDARVLFAGPVDAVRLSRVGGLPGVAAVERIAHVPVSVRFRGHRYETSVVAFRQDTKMRSFRMSGGGERRLPNDGLLAGKQLHGQLGVRTGDTVELTIAGSQFAVRDRVRGFVKDPIGTFVYTSIDRVDPLPTPLPAGLESALVRYDRGVDRHQMRDRIAALGDVTAVEDQGSVLDTFRQYMSLLYAFLGFMLVFGAAMAFALLFTSMSVNVAERATEVASLRASGVSHRAISRMITAENLLVAALGLLPGVVLGFVLTRVFLSTYDTDLWAFDIAVRWSTPLLSVVAVMLVALLSQWPGLRAVHRLDVATVVRQRSA